MGKINVDKIVSENHKKRIKYGNEINVYINLYLKDGFRMEFTAC